MNSAIALPAPSRRYGLAQVLRAEFIKISSLRSTIRTLLALFVGSAVVTVLVSNGKLHHTEPGYYQGFDPTRHSLNGLMIAVLAIGVLGALAATGEYSTGTIRSSLAAAPRRPLFLAAKALVVGAIAFIVGEAVTLVCFGIGQVIFAHGGAPSASLGDPAVLRAVLSAGAFIGLLGLTGLGLGVIVRHTAGGIAAYAGFVFVLSLILSQISQTASRFAPINMLGSVASVIRQPQELAPWTALGVMGLYTVASLIGAGVLLMRRDA